MNKRIISYFTFSAISSLVFGLNASINPIKTITSFFNSKHGVLIASQSKAMPSNINTFPIFKDKNVAILVDSNNTPCFAGNLINALQDKSLHNKIKFIDYNLKTCIKQLIKSKPEIVILPQDNTIALSKVKEYAGARGPIPVLTYQTLESIPFFNISVPGNKEDFETTLNAIMQHKTQERRTKYDVCIKFGNMYSALLANYRKISIRHEKYANNYNLCYIDKNGNLSKPACSDKFYLTTGKSSNAPVDFTPVTVTSETKFILISSHPDDTDIACSYIERFAFKANARVFLNIFGTGEWGVQLTPEEVKEGKNAKTIRREEAENAVDILKEGLGGKININNLDLPVCSQNPSLYPDKHISKFYKYDKGYKKVLDILNKQIGKTKGKNIIVAAPSIYDAHVHHRISSYLTIEALKAIAKEKQIKLTVLFYLTPWSGNYNTYFHSEKDFSKDLPLAGYFKEMLGSLTGELTCKTGFGKKSPSRKEMGGNFAERFERKIIRNDKVSI